MAQKEGKTAAKSGTPRKRATAATKRAKSTRATAKAKPRKQSVETAAEITAEERQRMIAETAYYRAERRGFYGGDTVHDWLAAEAEVDARLQRAG